MSNQKHDGVPDALLDEMRQVKQALSSEFDHDVRKLCAQLQQDQRSNVRRLVNRRTGVGHEIAEAAEG